FLTELVVYRASAEGFDLRSPAAPEERGGIVMLELLQPQQTVADLASRGFTVDYRPGLVRISPHFFNTADDVDRLMDAIVEVQSGYR
ncbi:MAG TPA: aminotransferase class V-fold PLP-dependent enzyme, partial [Chloroflexota bacterium]